MGVFLRVSGVILILLMLASPALPSSEYDEFKKVRIAFCLLYEGEEPEEDEEDERICKVEFVLKGNDHRGMGRVIFHFWSLNL